MKEIIDELARAVAAGKNVPFVFFWGHTPKTAGVVDKACLSQWWPCSFVVDGNAYSSAEQFMMAEKARIMGDEETRARIFAERDPKAIKALGRAVKNYDAARWDLEKLGVVVAGNLAKFSSDPRLKEFLLSTGDAILVEASPEDTIWGIGLAESDARARDPAQWRGANLLGFALMRVRASTSLRRGSSADPGT